MEGHSFIQQIQSAKFFGEYKVGVRVTYSSCPLHKVHGLTSQASLKLK